MGHKYPCADRVTTVNLRSWLCNKMSGYLPGEIPCDLKASRHSQQNAATTERRRLHAIAEQAIELLFFMFYIFLLSTDKKTGGLSIIHQSTPQDKVVL